MDMISYKDATLDELDAYNVMYPDNGGTLDNLTARQIYDICVDYVQMIYACEEIDRNHRSRLINIANHNYNVRLYGVEVVSAI